MPRAARWPGENEALGVRAEGAAQLAGFARLDIDGDGGVAGVGELARHEALPDEGVGAELVAVEDRAERLGGAEGGGGADGLVGLLGAASAGAVDALLLGDVVAAPAIGGEAARFAAGDGGDAEGVGAHVGDEADGALPGDVDALVELLGEGHRALRPEAEAVVRGLLVAAGGEGRSGAPLALALLDRLHGEVGAAEGGEELVGGGLVGNVALLVELLDAGEAGELRAELLAVLRDAGVDGPVLLRGEGLDLALALNDETEGDALDPSGAGAAGDLALHEPAEGIADQAVEHAAGLLRLDELAVELAGVLEGGLDGGLRDLVEDDALGLLGGDLGRLEDVPGDGLALAVGVGGEEDALGLARGGLDLLDDIALVLEHLVGGLEGAALHIDAIAVVGQVANVADGGDDAVLVAEDALDGAGLGGGLDDDQVLAAAGARTLRDARCGDALRGLLAACRGGGGGSFRHRSSSTPDAPDGVLGSRA